MTIIHSQRTWTPMPGFDVDQRKWLRDLLDQHKISPTDLARRASLDPSTLTRFLAEERPGHMLSPRTVRKIEQSLSVEPASLKPLGLDDEAVPYSLDGQPSPLRSAVLAIKGGKNGVDPWLVAGDDLDGLKLHAGDILMVDLNAEPSAGDIVCVQVYDWASGRARSIFRLYEPPYLLSGSTGNSRRPEVVDGRNVVIRGVMIARLSPRQMLRLS